MAFSLMRRLYFSLAMLGVGWGAGLAFVSPNALAAQTSTYDGLNPGGYLAAREAIIVHDFVQAAIWFAQALDADPANPRLLEGMIVAQIGAADIRGAAQTAADLEALGGTSLVANLALVALAVDKGDYEAVAARLEAQPLNPLLDRLILAWASFGAGNMKEAQVQFGIVASEPNFLSLAQYHNALAFAAAGDFESSNKLFEVLQDGPFAFAQRFAVARVQVLSQLERFDEALALLNRVFDKGSDFPLGDFPARLAAHEALPFTLTPTGKTGIAEAFFSMALVLSGGGNADVESALPYARIAAFLDPNHAEANVTSAQLLTHLGQYDLAGLAYDQVAPDRILFIRSEVSKAEALYLSGRVDEALGTLRSLSVRFPKSISPYIALGDALSQVDDYSGAILAYDAGLDLISEPVPAAYWAVYYARGVAYFFTDDWAASEEDLRIALALSPGNPTVLNHLGYALIDRGEQLEEALAMIRQAVRAAPNLGAVQDSLGWAYYRLGRYQDALSTMERASVLEPVDPVVTDHLGDVYWAVGRENEARFQWRRALSFEPADVDAARIRLKLEMGLDALLVNEGAPALVSQ